ncbi:MAG: hypothetical protein J1E41_01200 [Ruminococcus sp.]|nr:hypothetical protein [Ruminococcus sp.]
MKSKLCWISFIPFAILAVVIEVLQNNSILFSKDSNLAPYLVVGAVLVILLINIIFVAIDKKSSPVYLLSMNIPAAAFATLAAALVASKSALIMILDLQNHTYTLFTLALSVFGILTSICLVIIALAHIQGRNFFPRMGVLFLSMPVWAGLMLISEFLSNRTVSVSSVNPINLFCYAFTMIFLFKLAMLIATVDGKNPVKSMYLYGLPLAGLGLAVGVNTIFSIIYDGFDYSENIISFAFFAFALYVISFNIELSKNSYSNEEQLLEYDLDDFDNNQSITAIQDNFVVMSERQTDDYDYDYSSVAGADDDFVVAPDIKEDDVIYIEKNKAESFEEGVVGRKSKSEKLEIEDSEEQSEMNKIDKIIEDIDN